VAYVHTPIEFTGTVNNNPFFGSIIIVPDLVRAEATWEPVQSEHWEINKGAQVWALGYDTMTDRKISDIVSWAHVEQLAKMFREMPGPDGTNLPVVLVGCGYGGILCEKALVSAPPSPWDVCVWRQCLWVLLF